MSTVKLESGDTRPFTPESESGSPDGQGSKATGGLTDLDATSEISVSIKSELDSGVQSMGTNAGSITSESNVQPPKPTKKRGRPKLSGEGPTPTAKKLKTSTKTDGSATKKKDSDTTDKKTPKPRGRAAGTGENFTPDQNTYIRELFTSSEKLGLKEIHQRFEERFKTGKSSNTVRFRWYKMKSDAIILSPNEVS
ncbi:hypothetical protein ABW19_dt0209075 [Dactylella cylindrospora]|nr:hypothetical protein ABW19_dt0209075 [Dactylella cylindrospora]